MDSGLAKCSLSPRIELIASPGYSDTAEPEVGLLETIDARELARMQREHPTCEHWAGDYERVCRSTIAAEGSRLDFVIDDLNAIDRLFAFLGISTTFGLVSRARPRGNLAGDPREEEGRHVGRPPLGGQSGTGAGREERIRRVTSTAAAWRDAR